MYNLGDGGEKGYETKNEVVRATSTKRRRRRFFLLGGFLREASENAATEEENVLGTAKYARNLRVKGN